MKGKIFGTILIIVAIIGGIFAVKSFEHIEQGEVGVVWTYQNGVQDEVLAPGGHFVHPLARVKAYPVSEQKIVFSNNPADYNEDKHADWSIDAPVDGGMVKLNMSVKYNFLIDRVTDLYTRFNGMDGEAIVDNMVQNDMIAYIKEVTPGFTLMDVYSDKRAEVSKAITDYLNGKLNNEYGINIKSAVIIDVQLDDVLMEKIKAKEQAKQDAEKAELDKQTAIAQAETDKVKAAAEAAVAIEKARGEAEANRLVSQSITSELIQMKEAEARLEHGWITINGADTIIATSDANSEANNQ